MTDLTVSKTILEQLGGNRFRAMTGARNFTGTADSLSMKIASVNYDGKRVNAVIIRLDPTDTYTVEALFVTAKKRTVVASQSDVYCDNLQEVFTKMTGLYTHF